MASESGKSKREIFERQINLLKHNFEKTTLLFLKKRKPKEIDKWIFSRDDLPKFGKEYWFIHLASTNKSSKDQMILTFGHSEGNMAVNGFSVDSINQKNKSACVIWAYQGKKIPISNSVSSLILNKNCLETNNRIVKMKFAGNYPDYMLKLENKKKVIASIRLFGSRSKEKSYEFIETFRGIFGFELINLHLDFAGNLNNKKIQGKALVQKVIATGPFMPWRWGRIVFNDGSILSFFKLQMGGKRLNYTIKSSAYFYNGKTEETIRFNGISVRELIAKKLWLIQSDDKKLSLLLEPYSSEFFKLESRGMIEYQEYLVNVKHIKIKAKKSEIDINMLGGGMGILENTIGHMI